MKATIGLLLFALSFLSCSKESEKVDEVRYEVTLINSATWHGSYFNENAQVVGITNAPSGWSYSFKNTNKLLTLVVTAYPDGLGANADCLMKIYLNGIVVASSQSSISPQAQYVYP